MTAKSRKSFKWAILGTGPVSRKFAFGLRALGSHVKITAVASRNPENARRFADDFGIPHAAESYADVLQGEVDALYVATPPSLHEEHAKLAIAAGKAVLVEKPFSLDADSAGRIADAARTARVFCMEALWTRFLPLMSRINSEIKAGSLGEIRGLHGSFPAADYPDPSRSIFDPARGGGALMHRGIYPLSLARRFLGPVTEIEAIGRIGETGVDEDCALVLRHEAGGISTVRASLRTEGASNVTVYGTTGTLTIASPIWRPARAVLSPVRIDGRGVGRRRFEAYRETTMAQRLSDKLGPVLSRIRAQNRVFSVPYVGNGYHYEALALIQGVRAGETESPVMPLAESIEIMRIIETARVRIAEGETA